MHRVSYSESHAQQVEIERKVHAVIDKSADRGFRSLAVAY